MICGFAGLRGVCCESCEAGASDGVWPRDSLFVRIRHASDIERVAGKARKKRGEGPEVDAPINSSQAMPKVLVKAFRHRD